MHAVNALLFLGAFFLALFVLMFLAGAVIHLASLVLQVLRAIAGPKSVKAEAAQPRPVQHQPAARPAIASGAAQDELFVGASPVCART